MVLFDPTTTHRPNLYRVSGPDAADYFHRLTTANFKNLHPGQSTTGLFLTAQGKIKCFFSVGCRASQEFLFEVESNDSFNADFTEVVESFRFAEKFTIELLPWKCIWIFDSLESPLPAAVRIEHNQNALGREWISIWSPDPITLPTVNSTTFAQIEAHRIRNLSPRIGFEILADQNPLEINLHWAIAANKGCYPGQEVIEKIISLGSPARRLCRVEITSNTPATFIDLPAEIRGVEDQTAPAIGKLTSYDPTTGSALAVLRKTEAIAQKTIFISTQPPLFAKVLEISET